MSVEQLIDKSSGAGGGREDGLLPIVYFSITCTKVFSG